MARNLKEAAERHRRAAEDLDRALRDCLAALARDAGDDARFQVIEGGRRSSGSGQSGAGR